MSDKNCKKIDLNCWCCHHPAQMRVTHQHAFGRNPHVPGDLLDEPLNVVPATAGLSDLAVAKTPAIRNAARKAVLELQDSSALRRALAARPHVPLTFESGDLVAYWRGQKLQNGQVVQ